MRLLYDGNISPKLVELLEDIFPNSSHIFTTGLQNALDEEVWKFARKNGYSIVTKDSDFQDLSTLDGFPPKVIWIRLGNCSTSQIENSLRSNHEAIQQLTEDPETGILSLF